MFKTKYCIKKNGQEYVITDNRLKQLNDYAKEGRAEYEWLRRMLENDLVATIAEAPTDIFENLPAYIMWLDQEGPK